MTTYPLQLTCIAVICGTPLLASVFVALRIYTRRKLNLRLGWDDWLIIVPLILSIALIGPSYRHVKMWHVGIHIWDVDPNDIEPNYDEYYAVLMAFNLLNIPILPLVKASIILLLLRAGSVIEWLKKVLYAILVFTVGSALIPWFLFIFICPPRTGNTWAPRTFGGLHCMGRHKMGEMLIWVTCANLLTDVLILPIPFIIVRRMMSARLRSRLVVLTVFTCTLAVTAIGAGKIYLSYRDRLYTLYNPDWTYPIDYCISHVENNVAIIVANIPILRGLVTRWVFNFKTKATPMDREFRGDEKAQAALGSRTTRRSSEIRKYARKNRVVQKILPCIRDDFSSSLASHATSRRQSRAALPHDQPEFPARCLLAGEQQLSARQRARSYFPRSRRNSAELRSADRTLDGSFAAASMCEKGDALATVHSIGSLGSAPTLVDPREVSWKAMDLESPTLSPRRFSATPATSPVSLGRRARLRGIEDEEEEDDEEEEIFAFPLFR